MENVQSKITARIENGKIIVEIPVDLLVFAQKGRPESPYIVTDEEAMAQYVAENVLSFGGDSETGDSAFERLLDSLFDTAYEDAEEWLGADGWDD